MPYSRFPIPYSLFPNMTVILQHLGWGLFHSLWIITVLAVVYGVVSLFIPKRLRYCVGYAVLLAMLILPAVTCFMFDPIVGARTSRPHVKDSLGARTSRPPDSRADETSANPGAGETPALHNETPALTDAQRQFLAGALEILYPKNEPVSAKPDFAQSLIIKPPKPFRWERALPVLALLWCLGVIVCIVRLLPEWFALRRLRKTALVLEDGLWVERLRRLTPRKILLAASEQLDSPILVGLVKPMILVPMSVLTGVTPAQIDLILSHELVHIRRYDYLANLVQLVVETLLFYHPLVWWVSRRVRRDREYLCDDLVVATAETNRVLYAKTLLHLEQLRLNLSGDNTMKRLLSTPAATARPLMTRVNRILGLPAPATNDRTLSGIAGAILLALLIVTPLVLYNTQSGLTQAPIAPTMTQPVPAPMGMPMMGGMAPAGGPMMGPPGAMPMAPVGGMGFGGPLPPGQPLPANHPVIAPPMAAPKPPQPGETVSTTVHITGGRQTFEQPIPAPTGAISYTVGVPTYAVVPHPPGVLAPQTPSVLRVYSLKEMLDGLSSSPEMNALVLQIMEGQLKGEFPCQRIELYQVPNKPAIIIAAPQPVHDTVDTLLESLKEVCETLKKLDGATTVVATRGRAVESSVLNEARYSSRRAVQETGNRDFIPSASDMTPRFIEVRPEPGNVMPQQTTPQYIAVGPEAKPVTVRRVEGGEHTFVPIDPNTPPRSVSPQPTSVEWRSEPRTVMPPQLTSQYTAAEPEARPVIVSRVEGGEHTFVPIDLNTPPRSVPPQPTSVEWRSEPRTEIVDTNMTPNMPLQPMMRQSVTSQPEMPKDANPTARIPVDNKPVPVDVLVVADPNSVLPKPEAPKAPDMPVAEKVGQALPHASDPPLSDTSSALPYPKGPQEGEKQEQFQGATVAVQDAQNVLHSTPETLSALEIAVPFHSETKPGALPSLSPADQYPSDLKPETSDDAKKQLLLEYDRALKQLEEANTRLQAVQQEMEQNQLIPPGLQKR